MFGRGDALGVNFHRNLTTLFGDDLRLKALFNAAHQIADAITAEQIFSFRIRSRGRAVHLFDRHTDHIGTGIAKRHTRFVIGVGDAAFQIGGDDRVEAVFKQTGVTVFGALGE